MWNAFRQKPTARCCCWVVPQDELNMIDTFYHVNAHESSETPEILQNVAKKYPNKLTVFHPKLEMDNAIRELMCEYADQDDNCTHFRKAFFELTQTIPKKDALEINKASKKAFDLARLIGYPHLEVAVLCSAATGLSSAGKLQMAIQVFDEAASVAKAAEDKPIIEELPEAKLDLEDGNIFKQLGMQILFFKAAAYLAATPPQQSFRNVKNSINTAFSV